MVMWGWWRWDGDVGMVAWGREHGEGNERRSVGMVVFGWEHGDRIVGKESGNESMLMRECGWQHEDGRLLVMAS
jgi:hypothetical protein